MLKCRSLHKSFNSPGHSHTVLSDFNLELAPGSFNVLIGGNGAGKSTLLGLITGSQTPDRGQMLLADEDLTPLPVHERLRRMTLIHQNTQAGSVGSMTLFENMALAEAKGKAFGLQPTLSLKALPRAEQRRRYQALLASLDMGLETRLDLPAHLLSGGQRQALTLAMSLQYDAKLLLLDEHTAALDPKTSEQVMALTDQFIRQHQLTTLMVTHDLEQAIAYGDRLLLLEQGKISLDLSGAQKKALQTKDLLSVYYHQPTTSTSALHF